VDWRVLRSLRLAVKPRRRRAAWRLRIRSIRRSGSAAARNADPFFDDHLLEFALRLESSINALTAALELRGVFSGDDVSARVEAVFAGLERRFLFALLRFRSGGVLGVGEIGEALCD
jgi:hypothetical protein